MSERLKFVSKYWEGVYAADFTLEHVRRYCYRLGEALVERRWSCLVGYDTRFMSNLFARDIYRNLALQGVSVRLLSAPTPMPAIQSVLDRNEANCALVVSARNRPYWYNGLVLMGPVHADLPLQTGIIPDMLPFPPFIESSAQVSVADSGVEQDARTPYLEELRKHIDINLIRRSTLTIFVDPINGTTVGYFPAVLGDGGQTRAIEINRETDPLFGRLTPSPMETGLNRLRKLVRESDSHLGLAFSADGAAIGVVDKNGEQLESLEIILLLAAYLARQYRQKGLVIVPPPRGSRFANVSMSLTDWENTLGLHVELSEHAGTRIAEVLSQGNQGLLIGGTAEGELTLGHYALHPDALLAGLMLAELVARNGGNLQALLNELRGRLTSED